MQKPPGKKLRPATAHRLSCAYAPPHHSLGHTCLPHHGVMNLMHMQTHVEISPPVILNFASCTTFGSIKTVSFMVEIINW